jgi:hypothetical protein
VARPTLAALDIVHAETLAFDVPDTPQLSVERMDWDGCPNSAERESVTPASQLD